MLNLGITGLSFPFSLKFCSLVARHAKSSRVLGPIEVQWWLYCCVQYKQSGLFLRATFNLNRLLCKDMYVLPLISSAETPVSKQEFFTVLTLKYVLAVKCLV